MRAPAMLAMRVEPRETDGLAAKVLQCGIASEALRRNMPLRLEPRQVSRGVFSVESLGFHPGIRPKVGVTAGLSPPIRTESPRESIQIGFLSVPQTLRSVAILFRIPKTLRFFLPILCRKTFWHPKSAAISSENAEALRSYSASTKHRVFFFFL